MEQQKLNEFKDRLTQEYNRLEEELQHSHRFDLNQSLTDSINELSAYDNHPADLGSETFEREKDLALWNNAQEIQLRVEEALNRLEQGKYGICEDCGREIALERLEAIPYTTMCIDCQQEDESQRQTRERPVEEEVLSPPFSRTFLDNTEMVGTDGEDIWQAVAQYGTSETPSDMGGVADYGAMYYDSHEDQGIVEAVDGIIDVGPDEIAPDPDNSTRGGRRNRY